MFVGTGLVLEKLVILYLPVNKLQQGSKYMEFPCVSQISIFLEPVKFEESLIFLLKLSTRAPWYGNMVLLAMAQKVLRHSIKMKF